jgi:hypothetical protein
MPWRHAPIAAATVEASYSDEAVHERTSDDNHNELPLPLIAGLLTFVLVLLVALTLLQSGGSDQPGVTQEPPAATQDAEAAPEAP